MSTHSDVDAFRLSTHSGFAPIAPWMWQHVLRGRRNSQIIAGMALLLVVNQCDRHWFSVRIRASRRQGQRFPVRRNREPAMSMIFSVRLFCIIGKRIGVYLLDRDAVIRRSLT